MTSVKSEYPWPEGVRKTPSRKRLLKALSDARQPMNVQHLETAINEDGNPSIWLSTLYRALDVFVENDIANRTLLPDGSQAVYELNRHGHHHYAFCILCHKMIPVERCPVDPDAARLADDGFRITGHKLEVFGYCSECLRTQVGLESENN